MKQLIPPVDWGCPNYFQCRVCGGLPVAKSDMPNYFVHASVALDANVFVALWLVGSGALVNSFSQCGRQTVRTRGIAADASIVRVSDVPRQVVNHALVDDEWQDEGLLPPDFLPDSEFKLPLYPGGTQ